MDFFVFLPVRIADKLKKPQGEPNARDFRARQVFLHSDLMDDLEGTGTLKKFGKQYSFLGTH